MLVPLGVIAVVFPEGKCTRTFLSDDDRRGFWFIEMMVLIETNGMVDPSEVKLLAPVSVVVVLHEVTLLAEL